MSTFPGSEKDDEEYFGYAKSRRMTTKLLGLWANLSIAGLRVAGVPVNFPLD